MRYEMKMRPFFPILKKKGEGDEESFGRAFDEMILNNCLIE